MLARLLISKSPAIANDQTITSGFSLGITISWIIKDINRLEGARKQLRGGQPIDIISGEIRLAMHSLAEIIGETTSEDVIMRIFSEFCVGK